MNTPKSVIIKKSDVIKALKSEPLSSGNFFKNASDDLATCNVCAVGAVLRKSLGIKKLKALDHFVKTYYGDHIGVSSIAYLGHRLLKDQYRSNGFSDLDQTVAEKNYLGALSIYFEWLSDPRFNGRNSPAVTPEVRELLVGFVKRNFPTRFKLDLV